MCSMYRCISEHHGCVCVCVYMYVCWTAWINDLPPDHEVFNPIYIQALHDAFAENVQSDVLLGSRHETVPATQRSAHQPQSQRWASARSSRAPSPLMQQGSMQHSARAIGATVSSGHISADNRNSRTPNLYTHLRPTPADTTTGPDCRPPLQPDGTFSPMAMSVGRGDDGGIPGRTGDDEGTTKRTRLNSNGLSSRRPSTHRIHRTTHNGM